MAPYLKNINSDKTELIQKLEEKNKEQVEEYDRKLKDAEENEGDSEISELLRNKAMYFVRIGDKVGLRLLVSWGWVADRDDLDYRSERSRL